MSSNQPEQRRLLLERGSVVVLHPDGPAGGFPRYAAVDHVSDGLHWFLGSCQPLGPGEMLMVEYPIPNDARYVAHAKLEACSEETFALCIDVLWERAQQREFVRISTHGLVVRVMPAEAGAPTGQEAPLYPLLDISAGGIRFRANGGFDEQDAVICHFELPGSECFVLPARIVRSGKEARAPENQKPEIAVEFESLAEDQRGELLRWVYREQVKRHHEALRRAKQLG